MDFSHQHSVWHKGGAHLYQLNEWHNKQLDENIRKDMFFSPYQKWISGEEDKIVSGNKQLCTKKQRHKIAQCASKQIKILIQITWWTAWQGMVEGKYEKAGGGQTVICICWAFSGVSSNWSTISSELNIKKNYRGTCNWKIRKPRFRYGWI